jgi:CheY-like chemotaxis protein
MIIQELEDVSSPIGEETAEQLRKFCYVSRKTTEYDRERFQKLSGKVLIVDDVQENLLVVKGLLEPYGVTVHAASSGQEALEKIKNNYDLILMDHMMPEMDGIETARAIRAEGTQVPIVALTANAMQGMKDFYLEQGFQGYISKPINPAELDKVMRRWLGTVSSEQRTVSSEPLTESKVMAAAMEAGRLDMLNHFRAAFENRQEFDASYFEKFTSLMDTFITENLDAADDALREQAVLLREAGRRRDAATVKETLGDFINTVKNRTEKKEEEKFSGEILTKLKNAIVERQTKLADSILAELGTVNLKPAERELYFLLYDFMLEGDYEKAVGALNLWERLS